jgi:hypothetical protein
MLVPVPAGGGHAVNHRLQAARIVEDLVGVETSLDRPNPPGQAQQAPGQFPRGKAPR